MKRPLRLLACIFFLAGCAGGPPPSDAGRESSTPRPAGGPTGDQASTLEDCVTAVGADRSNCRAR